MSQPPNFADYVAFSECLGWLSSTLERFGATIFEWSARGQSKQLAAIFVESFSGLLVQDFSVEQLLVFHQQTIALGRSG